jgi:hypothetical protein
MEDGKFHLIFLATENFIGKTVSVFSKFDTKGFVPLGCFSFKLRLNMSYGGGHGGDGGAGLSFREGN